MRFRILSVVLAVFIGTWFSLQAQAETRSLSLIPGGDYAGSDYRTIKNTNLGACTSTCLADAKCKAFTFNTKASWCFLKSQAGVVMPFQQAVGGATTAPSTAAASNPNEQLTFIDAGVITAAHALADELKSATPPEIKDPVALRAEIQAKVAALDLQGSADLSRALITLGDTSYEAWRNLAMATNAIQTTDNNLLTTLNQTYLSAAYMAYEQAATARQKGEALALLGNALVRNTSTRAAIDAYRAAAAASPDPAFTTAYEDAKTKYGFHVLDYTVNADAADPQVCVQFSEDLKQGRVDFMPFVSVAGAAPAGLQATGRELCVDGLKRGERTDLTIRDGLPAQIGEVTVKPVTLSVFIRDRSPSVRFTGQGYVLPAAGRHGVPIVSVNAPSIDVEIYHVPERGLADFIKNSQFLTQLRAYDASSIGTDAGEKVWSGTLAAATNSNEEVTTSFPLDDVLKNRAPGVYVIMASPTDQHTDDWNAKATQWLLVSDLGLTTLSNQSGLSVFVRSLNSAKPVAGTEVSLVARNNQVLATAKTDDMGLASFPGGLMKGTGGNAPAIVTATAAQDFAFIDISRAAFDFSDRGVGGRTAPGPLDVFMYTDRGIYRPGHTVHLSAIARDDKAVAVAGLPLTFIVDRPDGVEYQRYPLADMGTGGYTLDVDLKTNAMRGMWSVAAYTDPKQPAISSMQFRVDDFSPDRIAFDLKSEAKAVALDATTAVSVDARFLYGAPASGLSVEGDLTLMPIDTLADYPGYTFGLAEKNVAPGRTELTDLGVTDDQGKAVLNVQPTEIPSSTHPLQATLNIRVVEGSGRAVERQLVLPATSSASMLGIKPLAKEFGEGDTAQFDVIAINAAKQRIASGPLSWELVRVRDDFQWYQKNGTWTYESTEYTDRVANGKSEAKADSPARLEAKLEWGHYRLIVESDDPNGPAASTDFYAGWYVAQTSSDSPDILQIALDKKTYKVGDTATVKIVPRFAGTALVNVVGETILAMKAVDIPAGGGEVSFPVTDQWGPGTYVTATLYRQASTESKMPGRAVGIMAVQKDEAARTLNVALSPPPQIQPRTTLTVPVAVGNLAPGETAHLTVAAVDVGVLNVTGFTPPDANGWFYGQRRLAMEYRDLYGRLVDGSLGNTGAIRSGGGDEDVAALQAITNPPTTQVVALFSGIVAVDAGGKATVTFDVPDFNGTLRLMAVAWSKSAVGDSSADVIVRDPIVISEGLPRVLAPGDSTRLRLDIDNTEAPDGDYQLSVATSDGLTVTVPQAKLTLAKAKRSAVSLPLKANAIGLHTIDVTLANTSGVKVERHLSVLVRPGQPFASTRQVISLAPGKSLDLKPDLLAAALPGTGRVTAAITRAGALDVPGLLQALDRYPYGCSEQTTSRALPLLYLEEVAARSGLEGDKAIKERVQDAIYRILANQSSEGAFGLWGPTDTGDLWLDAFVTDFLTRAREQGYNVPQKPLDSALANLQNVIGYTQNIEEKPADIAYAFYVLARNKKASIGDLRFYAETKLDSFPSPMAKGQLAAALALYGDKARAAATLDAAVAALKARSKAEDWLRQDYGSNLRDSAALLTLAVEIDPSSPVIPPLIQTVARFQAGGRWTSTQEQAWMLLAARGLLNAADAPKIEMAGKSFDGDFVKTLTASDLSQGLSITNRSDHAVDAILTTTAIPANPPPAGGEGFTIERKYYNLDGTDADLAHLKQSNRLVVTISVKQANSWPAKIMVTDLLPSGFEIDNPGLVSSANLANFDWLKEAPSDAYLEFRDDRFAASLNRGEGQNEDVSFAYVVRAVTPGSFVLPPAMVEDMYRPYLNSRTEGGLLEVK
jgi:uncharacterized protein YfaS (alpha-2-macroglobulin family)